MSFDTIVDRCLRNVFQLESVVVILDEIKDVIMRHSTEIRSKVVYLCFYISSSVHQLIE